MIEKFGNILDTEANYIGHGVNCQGVMGAGIAKQFRERFPINYSVYKQACNGGMLGGAVLPVVDFLDGRKVCVVNFASQYLPGPNARYTHLFESLYEFARQASHDEKIDKWGSVVAIPEIGCGIGGLEWPNVKKIIKAVESIVNNKIEFEVWHYKGDNND